MPYAAMLSAGPAGGGFLLVLAIMLPAAGVLFGLLLGGHHAERIALALTPIGLAVALAIAAIVWRSRSVLQYVIGGLPAPPGGAVRADGISVVMLLTAALLIPAIGLFARAQFRSPPGVEARAPFAFWTLLLALSAALN